MKADTQAQADDNAADANASPQAQVVNSNKSSKTTQPTYRNINSYYGHKIGIYQTVSLLLNAGLMLYAHLGLSAVIYSSRDPSITALDVVALENNSVDANTDTNNLSGAIDNSGTILDATNNNNATACNDNDVQLWIQSGGESNRPQQSNYCSRTYTDSSTNNFCFVTATCISTCFQTTYGYSESCSDCFAGIPTCSMRNLCTFACAADSFSVECQECNVPCVEEFQLCAGGLPEVEEIETINDNVTDVAIDSPPLTSSIQQEAKDTCNKSDLTQINTWYTVYELTFVRSINDAWNGDAQLLAIIIVLFSGIWPYAKNIILVIVWYTPMSKKRQSEIILWLSRLSKYTLVDVFAVIGVLVGVQLELNVGGTDAVIRAEPRFGIIAFFIATLWEFLQIELIKVMYETKVVNDNRHATAGGETSDEGKLLFQQLWIPVVVYIASLALYISGAVTELMFFENSDIGSPGVCSRSFNLATLGNALISPGSLTDNSTVGQTWILFLVYVILVLAFPVLTHILQVIFIVGWSRSIKLKRLIKWASAISCFACVEVLLIGVFAVEFKFPQLIGKLAGESNAGFLDIQSGLGTGFYILIVYSIVAGFLQWSLLVRYDKEQSSPEVVEGVDDKV